MSTIGIYGGAGGIGGALFGWFIGGPPGALAFSQIGASIGTKVGVRQFAANLVTEAKNTADQVVQRTVEMADFAGKYLLATGATSIAYWSGTKTLENRCSSSRKDLLCTSLDITGLSLAVFCAGSFVYMIKIARSHLQGRAAEPEPRRGVARMEEEELSPFATCVGRAVDTSLRSYSSSCGSCSSSFSKPKDE